MYIRIECLNPTELQREIQNLKNQNIILLKHTFLVALFDCFEELCILPSSPSNIKEVIAIVNTII